MKLIKWNNSPAFPDIFEPFLNDGLMGLNSKWNNMPAANIIEEDNDYELELAAPGYDKKDFKIDLENNVLTISSQKEEKHEEKNKDYNRREFAAYSFSRSFTLPETIEREKIKANYENGILHIVLPKIEEEKKEKKEIEIS